MTRAGLVIQHGANRYVIESDSEDGSRQPGEVDAEWACTLRGRLRKGRRDSVQLAVIGDRVEFIPEHDSESRSGVIEKVLPRRNKISRPQPSGGSRTVLEQVVMANVDRLWIVASLTEPQLNVRFVDRILAASELQGVEAGVVFNKCDLDGAPETEPLKSLYEPLGYPVRITSAQTGTGLDALEESLRENISVFVGLSGVGKSSLLSALEPGLQLRVQSVGEKHGHGRHTTTNSRLYALRGGGYLADTPGMREFGLWGCFKKDLAEGFREIYELSVDCRFRDCLHLEEPGCAVVGGPVEESRYLSYRTLLAELPLDALERDGILKPRNG